MNEIHENEAQTENPYESLGEKKSSSGCCLYGCLILFLLAAVVLVGGGFSAYWWVQGQVTKFTDDTPANLPIVELPEDELAEIEGRVDNFKQTIEAGETPDDLVLTAEELNALITKDEDLRGRVYVTIEDGEVTGDVSVPADFFPGGKGRFFNASATFDVSLENGVLIVTLTDATVKGEKVPQQFIDAMGKENLAKDAYKDPEVAAMLRRIESISIERDKIILKPRVTDEPKAEADAINTDPPPSYGEQTEAVEPAEPEKSVDDELAPTASSDDDVTTN